MCPTQWKPPVSLTMSLNDLFFQKTPSIPPREHEGEHAKHRKCFEYQSLPQSFRVGLLEFESAPGVMDFLHFVSSKSKVLLPSPINPTLHSRRPRVQDKGADGRNRLELLATVQVGRAREPPQPLPPHHLFALALFGPDPGPGPRPSTVTVSGPQQCSLPAPPTHSDSRWWRRWRRWWRWLGRSRRRRWNWSSTS